MPERSGGIGLRVGDLHESRRSMQLSQVTRAASSCPAAPNASASPRCSRSQPAASASAGALGRGDEPGAAVAHDLERPARVGRRQDGLRGEERLERHHPEVLVDRRVVDGEAAGVERGELRLVGEPGELDAAVETTLAREPLEPLAVGALARDHDAQAPGRARPPRSGGRSASRGRAGSPRGRSRRTPRSGRGAPAADAASPRRARPVERSIRSATLREVAKSRLRLAERDPVQGLDRAPQRPVLRFFAELAQIGSVELVGLAELVQHPDALVRVADAVGGELRRDDEVDRRPVRPPRGRRGARGTPGSAPSCRDTT